MDDFSDIRLAVIGIGHWHAVIDACYIRHFQTLGTQIVGVSDPDPDVAQSRGELFAVPAFEDFREMLTRHQPDFVLALGKHSDMAATASFLVDAGYPFMMEKPMGLSANEVQPIVERAESKGSFIAVPYAMRLSPFARRANNMVSCGDFGRISHAQFRMIRPTPQRYVDNESGWMLDAPHSGGGCLRNLGGHALDLFRTIAGPKIEVVAASISSTIHRLPVEDYAIVTLRGGEVLGTVEVGCNYPVDGTDGEWRIAGSEAHLIWTGDKLVETRKGCEPIVTHLDQSDLYHTCVREILTAWKRGHAPFATARDCLLADELIDTAYRLATSSMPADR